jgi:hypothetical protein
VCALDRRVRSSPLRAVLVRGGMCVVVPVVDLGRNEHRQYQPDDGADERTSEVADCRDAALDEVDDERDHKTEYRPDHESCGGSDPSPLAPIRRIVDMFLRRLHARTYPCARWGNLRRARTRPMFRVEADAGRSVMAAAAQIASATA